MINPAVINHAQFEMSCNFGGLLQVLLSTGRQTFKLISIAVQTLPAVRLNQVYVHRNVRGEPVAYALWAFVSDEVAAELRADPDRLLHYSEWNEGLNLWIMDFVSTPGHALEMADRLRTAILRDFDRVQGVRTRADGSIRRVVDARVFRAARSTASRSPAPAYPPARPAVSNAHGAHARAG